ncbi:MAG: MCE family protein [Solirubrobacterales bacterium]|nr:MCE family protein [Solirubrobacterales bacterium]
MASVGMVGVLAVVVLTVIGFNSPNAIPGRSYYNLTAKFDTADNLTAHYQVRMGGKLVGQVLDPRVEDGQAVVDLQLEPSVEPLRSDTTLEVRPRSPVGVRYLDIEPGQKGTPMPEGATIPAKQTGSTTQLDEVLSTFDPKTRARTQVFMKELGTGFAGRGQDLNDTIGITPKMLRDTRTVLSAFTERPGSIRSIIRGGGTLADTADPVRIAIADGFAPEAEALKPFTEERDAVQSTLDKAPGALATVRSGLPQVDPLIEQVRGLARDVRPALRAGPTTFAQTSALLQEARPGLRDADDTLELADDAVLPTIRLLDTVKPVLPVLDSTLENGTPLVSTLGAYGCDIVQYGERWTSMLAFGNQDGGALRLNLQFGPESVYGATARSPLAGPTNPRPEPCVAGTEGGN